MYGNEFELKAATIKAKDDEPGRYPVKCVWESGLIEYRYMTQEEIKANLETVNDHGIPYFRVL